jgi:enoyl-CoA hydratase/carnithine racemase
LAFEVRLERAEHVATLTIDNPPVNALHPDVARALEAHLETIAADAAIRAVVLTGAGKLFMGGGDIAYFRTLTRASAERYVLGIQRMQDAIGLVPQPVIAAVNGAALGGGCELAMACDLRIAEEQAVFAQPEVRLGIIPGAGGTQHLPRLIGPGRAKRMLFTGERISAAVALEWGLVEDVVPEGTSVERARALGAAIAANAPLAVSAAKRAVDLGLQMGIREAHVLEASLFIPLVETNDFTEGVDAFFDKRPPKFTRE